MNAKIVIPISVIITIVIVVFSLTQIEKETPPEISDAPEIQSMYDKLKEDKMKNDNSNKQWKPKEREWIQSGPFQIDRSEYILGEKIFVNIIDLPKNVKGTMVFTKIVNSTHSFNYEKIKFDGSKSQQNFYLGIYLDPIKKICTTDMLIGDWKLNFDGTMFESLKFKVTSQIMPGFEKRFEPVC